MEEREEQEQQPEGRGGREFSEGTKEKGAPGEKSEGMYRAGS